LLSLRDLYCFVRRRIQSSLQNLKPCFRSQHCSETHAACDSGSMPSLCVLLQGSSLSLRVASFYGCAQEPLEIRHTLTANFVSAVSFRIAARYSVIALTALFFTASFGDEFNQASKTGNLSPSGQNAGLIVCLSMSSFSFRGTILRESPYLSYLFACQMWAKCCAHCLSSTVFLCITGTILWEPLYLSYGFACHHDNKMLGPLFAF